MYNFILYRCCCGCCWVVGGFCIYAIDNFLTARNERLSTDVKFKPSSFEMWSFERPIIAQLQHINLSLSDSYTHQQIYLSYTYHSHILQVTSI